MINSIRCPDIDELDGLLEDALASDRRVELEDHLEHCATCQEKVATLDVDPVVANYLKAPKCRGRSNAARHDGEGKGDRRLG